MQIAAPSKVDDPLSVNFAAIASTLAGAGCVAADEEAAELIATATDPTSLGAMLERRIAGEPLAWITGTTLFCGLTLQVRPGVYVPRWQSETLAHTAAGLLPEGGIAADLCTGSGAIAAVMQAARPRARVVATEVDPSAAACARANGIEVFIGDLDDVLATELAGRVDVMTGVVPYVPTEAMHLLPHDVVTFEPQVALDGGPTGLEVVKRAVAHSTKWMAPGGWLLLEVGGDQFTDVEQLFRLAGYGQIEVLVDGDGDPRAVFGRNEFDGSVPRERT